MFKKRYNLFSLQQTECTAETLKRIIRREKLINHEHFNNLDILLKTYERGDEQRDD